MASKTPNTKKQLSVSPVSCNPPHLMHLLFYRKGSVTLTSHVMEKLSAWLKVDVAAAIPLSIENILMNNWIVQQE